MSITEDGIKAEKQARQWLRSKKIYDLQQIDWIVKRNNKWFIVEVKNRELFKPPPFEGTGLDISQLERRRAIFNDLKMDTLLVVFVADTVYYNWVFTVLEKTEYFDTKNKIRIYNITNFKKEKFIKT